MFTGDCEAHIHRVRRLKSSVATKWHVLPNKIPKMIKDLHHSGHVPRILSSHAHLSPHTYLLTIEDHDYTGSSAANRAVRRPLTPFGGSLGVMFSDPRYNLLHDMSNDFEDRSRPKGSNPKAKSAPVVTSPASLSIEHHTVIYVAGEATFDLWFPVTARGARLYCNTTYGLKDRINSVYLDLAGALRDRRKGFFYHLLNPSTEGGVVKEEEGGGEENLRKGRPSGKEGDRGRIDDPSPEHESEFDDPESETGSFAAVMKEKGIEVRKESVVAPSSETINVIFVSGGYKLEEKGKFFSNVSELVKLLSDPMMDTMAPPEPDGDVRSMHRSVPHNRYLPFWNIFSVFQPSVDSGASRPLHNKLVSNNLGCEHPGAAERGLYCRWELAQSLAAVAPADVLSRPWKSLIISLVNTPVYGGTGSYVRGLRHFGNFFNGFDLASPEERKRMLSLVDHEIGHAIGHLADEYVAIANPDRNDAQMENCQYDVAAPSAKLRWNWWVSAYNAEKGNFISKYGNSVGNGAWGVAASPVQQCYYPNYYRPNERCMMNHLTDYFMCPVCREATTVTTMSNEFRYTWPRYPFEGHITVFYDDGTSNVSGRVSRDTDVTFHLSRMLTRDNDFVVRVTDYDGSDIPLITGPEQKTCPCCFRVTKAMMKRYPNDTVVTIKVSVEDKTVFVSDPARRAQLPLGQLNQNTTFRLLFTSDLSVARKLGNLSNIEKGQELSPVGKAKDDLLGRYLVCDKPDVAGTTSPFCNITLKNHVYEGPTNIDGIFSRYDKWVIGVVIFILVIFILMWFAICGSVKKRGDGKLRPIFKVEFDFFIMIIRFVLMVCSICLMLVSIFFIVYSTYYYTKITLLGKFVIIIGFIFALPCYIMGFIGFLSVYSRTRKIHCYFLVGLVLFIAFFVTIFYFTAKTATELKDRESDRSKQLEGLWLRWVSTNPDFMCGVEKELKCSGWNVSCAVGVGLTIECPKNCEVTNAKYMAPCSTIIVNYFLDHYALITRPAMIGIIVLAATAFFNIIAWCALCAKKRKIEKANQVRLKSFSSPNSPSSLFNKGGEFGEGRKPLSSNKILLLLRSLNVVDVLKMKREFAVLDKSRVGTLNRLGFRRFFYNVLCYNASPAEVEEIFNTYDFDRDGLINMNQFFNLCCHRTGGMGKNPKFKGNLSSTSRQLSPVGNKSHYNDDKYHLLPNKNSKSSNNKKLLNRLPISSSLKGKPQKKTDLELNLASF